MNLDQILAFHCAPTIGGLKPANLIAHKKIVENESIINTINSLNRNGVFLEILWATKYKELTLIFNRELLQSSLELPEIWGYLLVQGYPMYSNLETILSHLKTRIGKNGDFPHEIGLFLGYPLVDVLGFIKNKGEKCKICGYWKVYGDEQEARCLFDSYSKIRDEMCAQVQKGFSVAEILNAESELYMKRRVI